MDKPKRSFRKGIMIAFSLIIMISFAGVATLGQKIWIGQEKKQLNSKYVWDKLLSKAQRTNQIQ
tara:strand:+ start:281 stop:472 length:192 start_codon:yes stop_codon:yes gene_type:complete